MSLIVLEDAIKEHIFESKLDVLPGGFDKIKKEDLDVHVADYFDLITGSASGSWVADYLATKGSDGTLREKLKDPEIVAKYGKSSPGTGRALVVFFNEYMNIIFPHNPPPAQTCESEKGQCGTSEEIPGQNVPTFGEAGLKETMEALFGENTLENCVTSVLNPITDIYSGGQTVFFADRFSSPMKTGFTNFSFSNPVYPDKELTMPYAKFNEGINFRLQDITCASTAGPAMFPWPHVVSVTKPETQLWGGDGYLNIAGFPAFQSVAFAASRTGDTSIENYAVLSLATGNAVPKSLEPLANAGYETFVNSLAMIDILLFRGGNDYSNQLDLLFSSNPHVGLNQCLRIQFYREAGTQEGNAVATLDDSTAIPILQKLGEELAMNYTVPIHQFVKNYIIG
eukprot:g3865.t1